MSALESGRARLVLGPGRERPFVDGHPWAFSGAIARVEGDPQALIAELAAADGARLGLGFHSPRSRIRWRRVTSGAAIDRDLFAARIRAAATLRRDVVPAETDGYRVLNAEGDGVPGWTVDRFGDTLVSQMTVAGLEALRESAYAALADAFPEAAVLHLGDLAARRLEGLPLDDQWARGPEASEAEFREHGLRFVAELGGGQKTGFYCDQRENRSRVERLAGGRAVLDLFSHSGAFTLYALRGGARRAVAVESAERLLALAARQLEANRLPSDAVEWVRADVFRFLREREDDLFDLVVCDPPPLARRKAEVERAARAYKDLNRLALGRLEVGGHLFTFSCSGAIDARLFRQILFAAAAEARVTLQLLAPLAAAPDHPVAVAHPEGEYLKGWWARVAERRSAA